MNVLGNMTRRQALLASWGAAGAFALAGCAGQSVAPAEVANDVNLIATGLSGALTKSFPTLPAAVTTALTDLASVASTLAATETTSAAQPLVQRVETDVNAIVAALPATLPAAAQQAIAAAQALLPVIEAAVGMIVAPKATRPTMTPAQARAILGAA